MDAANLSQTICSTRCLEEARPVPAKNNHVTRSAGPAGTAAPSRPRASDTRAGGAPGRRGRHPGTFGIVFFWTELPKGTSFLSLDQHYRTPISELLANLPAASGFHRGGAGPLNKWGSLHNTGDSDWGPHLTPRAIPSSDIVELRAVF